MEQTKSTICPKCKEKILYPGSTRNALSRRDNKTEICSKCGLIEEIDKQV